MRSRINVKAKPAEEVDKKGIPGVVVGSLENDGDHPQEIPAVYDRRRGRAVGSGAPRGAVLRSTSALSFRLEGGLSGSSRRPETGPFYRVLWYQTRRGDRL